MSISEVRLRLNPWTANALDYLSNKTGMDSTGLVRQAVLEYIQRRFTNYDFETVQSVMDGTYKDALDEWVHWNMHLKEIPKDQATLWKKLAIKSLEFMQSCSHMPMYKEFYKLGEWLKLKKEYESWLMDFLIYQFKIKEYHGEILIPKEDKYKMLLAQGKEDEYYNRKWEEYAENLILKMGDMTNPLFNILYQIKRDNLLVTDRETALFLLKRLIDKKAIKRRTEEPIRGPYGPTSDHLDTGEIAEILAKGKIKDNENVDQFLERKAWEEIDKQIKEIQDTTEKAEQVMKNINPLSYAISKRKARKFKDRQAGKDPFEKEKELAKKLAQGKSVVVDPSIIDEDILIEESSKLEWKGERERGKKKYDKKTS